jgi:hypothetical protein
MPRRSLKVGLVQTKVSEDLQENLDKTARFVRQAAKKGAQIVCLQELFAYQYFAQTKGRPLFSNCGTGARATFAFPFRSGISESSDADRRVDLRAG